MPTGFKGDETLLALDLRSKEIPGFDRFYLSPIEVRFGSWYSTRSRPGMSSKSRRFRVRKR